MPKYTAEQVADIQKVTLRHLGKGSLTDISLGKQRYVGMPQILRMKQKQLTGRGIKRQVMVAPGGNARQTGLFDDDEISVNDVMQEALTPWRYTTNNYACDLREEDMNAGPAEIVDLMRIRRHAAFSALADHLEDQIWSGPSSSTDTTEVWGIPHFVVKNATKGFNGGAPSGFSDVSGISPTTYERWKNYTFTYTNVTKADLIKEMREAHYRVRFQSPIPDNARVPSYKGGRDDQEWYVRYETLQEMEEVGEAQNENLGRDLASMDGNMLFRGNPIIPVSKLEDDSQYPIYALDWSELEPVFLNGWEFREAPMKETARSHNVVASHVDLAWNLHCVNRRAMAVGYQV